MIPLLALGLMSLLGFGGLGAGAIAAKKIGDNERASGADKVGSLLGEPPRDMGPPTEEGQMGRAPGFGLLQDPGKFENQARFMQGLLSLPSGQRDRASQMYGDMFNRLQQQGQFTSQEGRLGTQWGAEQQQRANLYDTQGKQWDRTFNANRLEAAQRLAIEAQRLQIEQQRAGAKEGDGLPKLSPGWMYGQSASGMVAMPIPGTKDYADTTGAEQSLVSADSNIGRFLDVYAGKRQGQHGIRVGGTGNEISGERAGELSSLRAKIIADVAVLQNKGVLQQGELEMIEKQLSDPTKLLADFTSTKGGTVKAYETLQQQFRDKLVAHRNANPWLLPAPPPGAVIDGAAPPRSPATPPRPSGGGGTGGAAPPVPGKREPTASIWDTLLTGKKREYQ
jgi:hypothetical protein